MKPIHNEGFALNYGSGDLASTRGDLNIFMQYNTSSPNSALQNNSGTGAPITNSPLAPYNESSSLPIIHQKG